jgi:hypothetical protein
MRFSVSESLAGKFLSYVPKNNSDTVKTGKEEEDG